MATQKKIRNTSCAGKKSSVNMIVGSMWPKCSGVQPPLNIIFGLTCLIMMHRWISIPIKLSINLPARPKISTTLKSPNGITSPFPSNPFWEEQGHGFVPPDALLARTLVELLSVRRDVALRTEAIYNRRCYRWARQGLALKYPRRSTVLPNGDALRSLIKRSNISCDFVSGIRAAIPT